MKVRVECHAGYKGDQEPRVLVMGGERRRILGVADRWYGPDADFFKVRADDGHGYLLRHDRGEDTWELVRVVRQDA